MPNVLDKPTAELTYAPVPHRKISRRIRWLCTIGLSLLCIEIAAVTHYHQIVTAIRRWQVYRLQSKCEQWTASPDQVVYDDRPTTPAYSNNRKPSAMQSEILGLKCQPWTDFVAATKSIDSTNIAPADPMHHIAATDNVVFLHKLRNPIGEERLVCITMGGYRAQPILLVYIIQPATRTTAAKLRRMQYITIREESAAGTFQLFAGQPDPINHSHFTISYSINGQPGKMDCCLFDDDLFFFSTDHGSVNGSEGWLTWMPMDN